MKRRRRYRESGKGKEGGREKNKEGRIGKRIIGGLKEGREGKIKKEVKRG